MQTKYSQEFYSKMNSSQSSNLSSAKEIVPYILSLFPNISSVIDFGCGTGAWLSVFKECGVNEIKGIDGNWVTKEYLLIDKKEFEERDLKNVIILDKKYDIAISLEVAEHIEKKYADIFVENLTNASDIIIFGAAIPSQGGTHHVNEQIQSYWKTKFESHDYVAIDPLRGKFCSNDNVMYCYAQNTLVYVKKV